VPILSSLLRVRPTKIELIRLRRRLQLARKVHRILRERLTILVNEFLLRSREAYSLRLEASRKLLEFYKRASILYSVYGEKLFQYYSSVIREGSRAIVGEENIAGVKTPTVRLVEPKTIEDKLYPELESLKKESLEILGTLIELGCIEEALRALGVNILRTKRKVNALEYMLIPQIINTIRYLRMKFEEREREEKARLKRVKVVLARRRGG